MTELRPAWARGCACTQCRETRQRVLEAWRLLADDPFDPATVEDASIALVTMVPHTTPQRDARALQQIMRVGVRT